jgi:DNA primase
VTTHHQTWAEQIRHLKDTLPIEAVIGRYFTLVPEGTRYLRAKEHDSLVVDRWTGRYHWNARGEQGDLIDFVCRQEGLNLREALEHLGTQVLDGHGPLGHPQTTRPCPPRSTRRLSRVPDREMLAALRVAVETYHAALLENHTALAYLAARGIDERTIRQLTLGFCDGTRLLLALEQAGVSVRDARSAGLLGRRQPPAGADGREGAIEREFLAGRIIVPEIGPAGPIWLIGRRLPDGSGPRYLSLPLMKPLLGYHRARSSPIVLVTEGVFDLLTLASWGLPAVALAGTDPGPRALAQLTQLARTRQLYLVPQADPAGQRSAARLVALLGIASPVISLPRGVKDLNELVDHPDLHATFLATLPPPVRALIRPGLSPPED